MNACLFTPTILLSPFSLPPLPLLQQQTKKNIHKQKFRNTVSIISFKKSSSPKMRRRIRDYSLFLRDKMDIKILFFFEKLKIVHFISFFVLTLFRQPYHNKQRRDTYGLFSASYDRKPIKNLSWTSWRT